MSKDPHDVEVGERHRVQELRLQLQAKIDFFKRPRNKAPYLEELLDDLTAMRNGLTRRSAFINKEKYADERRERNKEAVKRYRTRQKVQGFGIYVNVKKTGARHKDDGAPPLVMNKRVVNRLGRRKQRQRDKQLKQVEREELFAAGWGAKKRRM